MKYKLNGLQNVSKISTKKEIITTAIDLMGEGDLFTKTDIELTLMLAMVIVLENDYKVMDELNNSDNIEVNIITDIEPAFYETIMNSEEGKTVYHELVQQLIDYYNRKNELGKSLLGNIKTLIDGLSTIDMDTIIKLLPNLKQDFNNKTAELTDDLDNNKTVAKDENKDMVNALENIDNLKMKALIEKYQRIEE